MNDHEKYKNILIKPHQLKSNDPDSQLNNIPVPPNVNNFAVISPCFYKEQVEMETYSKKTFKEEEIKYITYGDGEEFTNKVYTNLLRLHTLLNEIEDEYDEVLIMDAKDALYLGGETLLTLITKWRNINGKKPTVILASEKECYPKGSDIFYNEKQERYLNSGLIMGETTLIKVMIGEMIQKYDLQRFELDNGSLNHSQIYWHRYFNEGKLKENIHIDYNHEFFYCMDSCDPSIELELINERKIRVKKTNTYPKIFHFNRCLIDEYKYLFGEFWVESLQRRGR